MFFSKILVAVAASYSHVYAIKLNTFDSCPEWQIGQTWNTGDCCTRYGRTYECRKWPYDGWCPTYDPSSMYGQDAWELTGGESLCREWEAGKNFGEGDCATNQGKKFVCKKYPENGWCPYYEPSGQYGPLAWDEDSDDESTDNTQPNDKTSPDDDTQPDDSIQPDDEANSDDDTTEDSTSPDDSTQPEDNSDENTSPDDNTSQDDTNDNSQPEPTPLPQNECSGDGSWTGYDWEDASTGIAVNNGCVSATTDDMQRKLNASRANQNPADIDMDNIENNPTNVQNAMNALGEGGFDYLFPVADPIYTEENFYKALAMYPAICGEVGQYSSYSDPIDSCKHEVATMIAHFAQETGANYPGFQGIQEKWRQSLWALTEGKCASDDAGSDACNYYQGTGWAAEAYPRGQESAQYFGRGAKQVSWNYNYGPLSKVIFGDVETLLANPEKVAEEGWLATVSAFWFYTSPQSPKPSMHDVVSGFWKANSADESAGISAGFGATINIINGALECSTQTQNAANRVDNYKGLMGYFKLDIPSEEELGCSSQESFPQDGAGAIPSYWEQDWSGGNKCQLVTWQTPYSLWIDGDYKRCVDDYF